MALISIQENTGTPNPPVSGKNAIYPKDDGNWYVQSSVGVERQLAVGNLSGPSGSIINSIATFADITGEVLQSSMGIIDGSGNMDGIISLTIGSTTNTQALNVDGGAKYVLGAAQSVTLDGGVLTRTVPGFIYNFANSSTTTFLDEDSIVIQNTDATTGNHANILFKDSGGVRAGIGVNFTDHGATPAATLDLRISDNLGSFSDFSFRLAAGSGADFVLGSPITTAAVSYTAATDFSIGGELRVFGSTHSSLANKARLYSNGNLMVDIDDSGGGLLLHSGNTYLQWESGFLGLHTQIADGMAFDFNSLTEDSNFPEIRFLGKNSATSGDSDRSYSSITAQIADNTSTTDDGRLIFRTMQAGVEDVTALTLDTGVVAASLVGSGNRVVQTDSTGRLSATSDISTLSPTLADVSVFSTTTAKSLYTMGFGIDVEFENSLNATILYLSNNLENVGIGTDFVDEKLVVFGSAGPTIKTFSFVFNNATPIGKIDMAALNSDFASYVYSETETELVERTVGIEASAINFRVSQAGSLVTQMRIGVVGTFFGAQTDATALVDIGVATTSRSALRLQDSAGVDPSSPNTGDMWWNATELFFNDGTDDNDLLLANKLNLVRASPTGYVSGLIIIQNAGNSDHVDIATGIVQFGNPNTDPTGDIYIEATYAGATDITPDFAGTARATTFWINTSGTLVQKNGDLPPDVDDFTDEVYIGAVVHIGTTIVAVDNAVRMLGTDNGITMARLIQALGTFINISGNEISATGTALKFQTAAGQVFGWGITGKNALPNDAKDVLDLTAKDPTTHFRSWRDGSGGVTTPAVPVTDLVPAFYDDGTVAVGANPNGAVGNNEYVPHRVYLFPNGSDTNALYEFLYGQNKYGSMTAAINAVLTETFQDNVIRGAAEQLGWIVMKGNATDVSNTSEVTFIQRFSGSSGGSAGGGVTDHGLLTGLSDDDHTQYLLTTGARDLTGSQNEAKGSDIPSATTTDIGAATGNYVDITGTTTITGLGTVVAGSRRICQFDGALTLTHNASSLILPGAASIVTVAGDVAIFISLGSGNWKCVSYTRADGTAVVGGSLNDLFIQVGNRGQANNTTGFLYIYAQAATNLVAGSTAGNGGGIDNGELFPIGADNNRVITNIDIVAAQAATGTGSVSSPDIRLSLFTVGLSGRTAFATATVDVPVSNPSDVEINNDLSGTSNAVKATISGLSITIPDDELWGVEFTNVTGDATKINALGRFYVQIRGTQ